jgi:hypothetical protein
MANCGQRTDGSTPNLTTTGLTNGGASTSYQIQYDDQITSSSAIAAFETLRANCDADFTWMQQLFGGAASPWSGQMKINIVSGADGPAGGGTGACWPNSSGPITLYPGVAANSASATTDPWFLRYLIVSEVVEMFMSSTGSDWYGGNWASGNEGSAGEGLSRFLGTQLLIQKHGATGGEPGYDITNYWLNSPRTDYVNNVQPGDNGLDPVTGCASAFVYYLFTQLGCGINQIIANSAKELSGVYQNITGDGSDPFPYFKNLLDTGYPGTATVTGPNLDNPWPIAIVSFVGVKSTFGAGESKDIVDSQSGLVSGAFTLWIEGLSKTSFASLNIQVGAFTGTFAGLQGVTIAPNPLGPQFESGVSDFAPQRIQIPFDLHLTAPFLNQFPNSGTATYGLSVSLNAASIPVTASQASTQIELVASADPYFTNLNSSDSNLPYLSQDLRVFTVTPGLNATPIPGVAALADSVTGAYSYIQSLLAHFNDPTLGFTNPNGPDPFTTVLPDQGGANQADSSVTPVSFDLANFAFYNNYNFAIARVRLRGESGVPGEAENVRVFFRLWSTQSNDTDYDPNTTYASTSDPAGQPGSPQVGAGNTTFPLFATNNFPTQTDYASGGPNNQTVVIPDNQDSVWRYYGCFLNLYDPNNQFNANPLQSYLNGTHHCLVAQIAYDKAPIPPGSSPLAWDQLAQRNLQVTLSDNPGPAATHRIPQTFDCRPSKPYAALQGAATLYPDELAIDWGRIPTGSVASLYWPQVLASDVVTLATQFYGANPLLAVDAHTIRIPITGGLSYVPIPSGGGQNFAGLFTVDLPASVRSGTSYDITVKRVGTRTVTPKQQPPPPPQPQIQVRSTATKSKKSDKSGHATHGGPPTPAVAPAAAQLSELVKVIRWRYVIGTFQVHIPVTTGDKILPSEETTLAIMKWRLQQMSASNRWYPVLLRYIEYISARVNGLGGDANAIVPSVTGIPAGLASRCSEQEFTGKVCQVLFDCHGDFEGFALEDCCDTQVFRSRANRIGNLALRACREELTVCVLVDRSRDRKIRRLSIRR